jgi:hypothetical protein
MEKQREEEVEKIDLTEEPGVPVNIESDAISQDIISQFDAILGNHMDRLLGTRHVEMLPMNIFTVSYLILLATRETEIQTFPYLPPERYKNETIMESLAEMNIESRDNLSSLFNTLVDKGYLNISDDGRFFPDPPAMKMAQVFDRIFPRMPGLNLVAYLGQMIDEVSTNRKELKAALNQFDQMLNLHGVPLKKEADSHQTEADRMFPHLKVGDEAQPAPKKIVTTSVKSSDIFSKLETKTWRAPVRKPEISASSEELNHPDAGAAKSAGQIGEEGERAFSQGRTEMEGQAQETVAAMNPESRIGSETVYPAQTDAFMNHTDPIVQPDQPGSSQEHVLTKHYQWNSEQLEDDDIEKRITEFEEQLGMACPLCRTSGIAPRTTAKGKQYYKCSSDDCNFISWGKPFYITCPKCENPFLIESPDSRGNMMLKCPRATCPHWQKFPWEENDEPDMKSIETQQTTDVAKKTRKLVKRRRRVVVRRKA